MSANTSYFAATFSEGELIPEAQLRKYLGSCGTGVRVFLGAKLNRPHLISIGDNSQVDEGVMVFSGEGVSIGRYVHLAFQSSISGGGSCEIGDFAGLGAGVRVITGTEVVDGSGLTNPTIPPEFRSVVRSKVRIESHAVVFTNSIIFPGVTVGEGAVVAAGSKIHHDLRPWRIYAGDPLICVGERPSEPILAAAARLIAQTGPTC